MSKRSQYKTASSPDQASRREIRRRAHWASVHWLAAYRLRDELEFVPEATPEDIAAAKAESDRLYVDYNAACLAAGRLGPPILTRVSSTKRVGTTIVRGIRVPVYRS